MTPMTRKAAIIAAVVILLFAAYFIGNWHSRRQFVNTSGKVLILSDTDANNPKTPDHPHIYIIGNDGSTPVRLTKGAETDADPSFSPDGSQVAFVSDRDHSPQVWVMNGDGTQADKLTIGNDAKSLPKFSPDGKTVGFISRGALTVVNAESRQQDIVYPLPHQGGESDTGAPRSEPVIDYEWCPVAGPNGTPIAVIQQMDNQQVVLLVGGALTDAVPVAAGQDVSCTWSADGKRLLVAFINAEGVRPPADRLSMLHPGETLTKLTKPLPQSAIYTFGDDGSIMPTVPPLGIQAKAGAGPQNPAISPSGLYVAYEVWPGSDAMVRNFIGIRSEIPATGKPGPLTMNGPVAQPEFSADGQTFGFTAPSRLRHGFRDSYVINFATQKAFNITNSRVNVLKMQISPAKSR